MRWSEQDYAALVRIGGKERIAAFHPTHGSGDARIPRCAGPRGSIIHKVKARLYRALVADEVYPGGIAGRCARRFANWLVAVCIDVDAEIGESVLGTMWWAAMLPARSPPVFAAT